MRRGWIIAALLIVIGLLPVASLMAASGVARLAGCRVSEGALTPCVILGVDWGGALQLMFTAGWLTFMTAPVALAGMILGIALAALSLWRRMKD